MHFHRDYDKLHPLHKQVCYKDILSWCNTRGDIYDVDRQCNSGIMKNMGHLFEILMFKFKPCLVVFLIAKLVH